MLKRSLGADATRPEGRQQVDHVRPLPAMSSARIVTDLDERHSRESGNPSDVGGDDACPARARPHLPRRFPVQVHRPPTMPTAASAAPAKEMSFPRKRESIGCRGRRRLPGESTPALPRRFSGPAQLQPSQPPPNRAPVQGVTHRPARDPTPTPHREPKSRHAILPSLTLLTILSTQLPRRPPAATEQR